MKRTMDKLAVAAALAAGMAFAQVPAAPNPPAAPNAASAPNAPGKARIARRGMLRQRMFRALDLTDAQKQQAKSIFQEARQNAQPLAQQLKQNREAMTAAVKANDVGQIRQLAAQRGTLNGQVLAIHSEAMAKFYNTLTPEQRAKADSIQQKVHQRMERRMQNRRNG